jgi:hypothetical protein
MDIGAAELAQAGGVVTVEDLRALSPPQAVEAKEIPGATGPHSVTQQLEQLKEAAAGAHARSAATPRLVALISRLT